MHRGVWGVHQVDVWIIGRRSAKPLQNGIAGCLAILFSSSNMASLSPSVLSVAVCYMASYSICDARATQLHHFSLQSAELGTQSLSQSQPASTSEQIPEMDLPDSHAGAKPAKRRVPRLPSHLSNAAVNSLRESQHMGTSALDTISEGSEPASAAAMPADRRPGSAAAESVSEEDARPDQPWGSHRFTHSPFMRSAIVQGAVPRSRVKPSNIDPTFMAIQPVLGLQGEEAAHGPGRLTNQARSSNSSPTRQSMSAARPSTPPTQLIAAHGESQRHHRSHESSAFLPNLSAAALQMLPDAHKHHSMLTCMWLSIEFTLLRRSACAVPKFVHFMRVCTTCGGCVQA